MRKLLFLLFVVLLVLSACGNKILSESFEADVNQVLPIIEKAHENQEDYSENESELLNSFQDKYKYGQYLVDEEYYEMNDVEKSIYNEINTMFLFAVDESYDEESTLASEDSYTLEWYQESREELKDLMKIKKEDKLPDDLKGKYPTYEIINGLYPEQFEDDANEILELYDPIINGGQSDVNNEDWYPLIDFIEQYGGDDPKYPSEYEQGGKYYIVNKSMKDVIKMTNELRIDIDDGTITPETMDHFDSVKEDLELFGNQ